MATMGRPIPVLVLTDVSRLKAQQAELEALARDRALMFNLSDVGLAYLRSGLIERANEALAALTGYTVAELLGMHLSALFADESAYSQLMPQQTGNVHHSQYKRPDSNRLHAPKPANISNGAAERVARISSCQGRMDDRQFARDRTWPGCGTR